MKVLGISMGRKNERSDIYCKQALMGVEAAAKAAGKDIEVEFIMFPQKTPASAACGISIAR